MFLLSTIENRVRQNRKILFFGGRKNILKKKSGIFFWKFSKIEKSKNGLKYFWTFFRDFENQKNRERKNIFSKNIFRSQKIKNFRRDFF